MTSILSRFRRKLAGKRCVECGTKLALLQWATGHLPGHFQPYVCVTCYELWGYGDFNVAIEEAK